jgi:hypothetical protein
MAPEAGPAIVGLLCGAVFGALIVTLIGVTLGVVFFPVMLAIGR